MSSLQKNVASQKWVVFAFDRTDNTPKTGDAAQITAKITKDYGSATAVTDTNPTEIEDGYYIFDLAKAETNADILLILPESSTGDIQVIGVPSTQTTVAYAIKTATDQIGSADITVSSPIATDGDITLHQYDDYNNNESRSLEWTNSDGDWGPDDITDATVEFVIRDSNGVVKLTADGEVVTPTGTQKVRVELTNEETDVLDYKTTYEYQLRLILDTSERQETIAIGSVAVTTSGFTS